MLVREGARKITPPLFIMFIGLLVLLYVQQIEASRGVGISKRDFTRQSIPDFSQYHDVKQKKQAFFAFMLPFVQRENSRLLQYRSRLKRLQASYAKQGRIKVVERKWLFELAKKYRLDRQSLDSGQLIHQLLLNVDAVPVSLALAQSANESAWGTSRFALKANNLFGQWCFSKGCGIVPLSRPVGAKFEMAKFTNPEQSVVAYMHNLNTNRAYINFRKMRKNMRGMNVPLSGAVLAEGLISYSQRRGAYIKELQAMIRVNKLSQYDSL